MEYNRDLVNNIRDILINKKQTVAVAESVTSGHIMAALSLGVEASKYFQGGMTVFNLGQKVRHLNVEPIEANDTNCVSPRVSTTMALQIAGKFTSDYGIAITGYASIVPENEDEGLFALVAISQGQTIVVEEKIRSNKETDFEAQIDYTNQVLGLFLSWLNNHK